MQTVVTNKLETTLTVEIHISVHPAMDILRGEIFITVLTMLSFVALSVLGLEQDGLQARENPYRLEVEFIRFEDIRSIKHNGRKCDKLFGSKCDPMIYAALPLDDSNPLAAPPQNTAGFELLIYAHNQDSFDVDRVLSKNICKNRSGTIKTFVRVIDYDLFKTDLMEDFVCLISTADRAALWDNEWSEVTLCLANFQPGFIKLSYRWRKVALQASDCVFTTPASFYSLPKAFGVVGTTHLPRLAVTFTDRRDKNVITGNVEYHSIDYTAMSGRRR